MNLASEKDIAVNVLLIIEEAVSYLPAFSLQILKELMTVLSKDLFQFQNSLQ
jgi:hypothetical protein